MYLSDVIHAYAIPGGKLGRKVEDVLECSCKVSAQVIEGLDSIANGWNDRC